MAILSNGKFSGFLCSIKDTGRKLKNGAAVMIEDFLSGFNGYGWKLWKKDGAWKLEIDELLVRRSFTTFEHIISQITSIKGGLNISQGHAKIKAVTTIEADVYKEVDGVETITKAPCYRLEIDDESNSIVEYDFVQCLKNGRHYLVQVGSVFQYYINIPVSEFDSDPDTGAVLNAPQAGDEIVQFGNASHQEKYKNRHSAIYLHVDDNEPAIDLMTEMYSKDWSKAIKVRVGGNLPGTEGDRGLYAVNGKIISVDNNGNVLYEFNPDGSGSLGKGAVTFDSTGFHMQDGTTINWDSIDDIPNWITTWTKNGTTIGNTFVVSPQAFFGKSNNQDNLTGVLLGADVPVNNEKRTGIFAFDGTKDYQGNHNVKVEIDPLNNVYKFSGEIQSDKGKIGGFIIDNYSLENNKGENTLVRVTKDVVDGYDDDGEPIYKTIRQATLGNVLPGISGMEANAYFSATDPNGSNIGMIIRAENSTYKHNIWGGNENFCISAVGGVNWKMNEGDHWCMPGVLVTAYAEIWYNNGGNPAISSTKWGNGIDLVSIGVSYTSSGGGNNWVVIKYKCTHKRFYIIAQNMGDDWNNRGHWGLTTNIETLHEEISYDSNTKEYTLQSKVAFWWTDNMKYIPNKSMYTFVGEPTMR